MGRALEFPDTVMSHGEGSVEELWPRLFALVRQPRRIILLSGQARAGDCHFHLEATIFATPDGEASGEILWTNIDTQRARADLASTEVVRGSVCFARLEFAGESIDPPLVCKRYRIVLVGGTGFGIFTGASSAYSAWDGRLSGTYQIVDQTA